MTESQSIRRCPVPPTVRESLRWTVYGADKAPVKRLRRKFVRPTGGRAWRRAHPGPDRSLSDPSRWGLDAGQPAGDLGRHGCRRLGRQTEMPQNLLADGVVGAGGNAGSDLYKAPAGKHLSSQLGRHSQLIGTISEPE